MKNNTFAQKIPMKARYLPYLWLAIAFLFAVFAQTKAAIPLAAWLAPIFLLRFVRSQKVLRGMLLAYLVTVAAYVIGNWNLTSPFLFYLVGIALGLLTLFPYLADRLIAPRLGGFVATLVFPLAYTTFEYLLSFGPYGTWFSLAYTQYGNLPLLQLVSVTGLWGVTFLMAWLAAVVNWAWEHHFAWPAIHRGALLSAGVLALVLLGGGLRLTFFPPAGSTVRIAAVTASRAVLLSDSALGKFGSNFFSGKMSPADLQQYRQAFARLDDDVFSRSLEQARAGAKIISWTEGGALVVKEDEASLLERGRQFARQEGVYLNMGIVVFMTQPPYGENETVLVDPSGKVLWQYHKAHPVLGKETYPPGDGVVPVVETPYGRLSNVICFDADFQSLMRVGTDLMLVPSNDWLEIDPMHAQMATFRAIENGYPLVRPTSNGLSLAVDYEGRVVGASDFYSTDQQVVVATLPMHGVHTIYTTIGDLFAWLSIGGLLALIGVVTVQGKRKRGLAPAEQAREAEPLPLPEPVGER
jgi:apolipoprotein N-acyltransferase